jgi:PKD repeat protein
MKKIYKTLFLSSIISLSAAGSLSAQNVEPCGTTLFNERARTAHPELVQKEVDYINSLKKIEKERSGRSAGQVYVIPMVFHVIHVNGPENIPDANIIAQVDRLNKDFRKLGADTSLIDPAFQGIAADCEIEFRLATIDPNGNCTNGIERIYSHTTFDAGDNAKLNQWPRDKYLNVWVINNIPSDGAGTILAYAYYPSAADGVMYPFDGILMISSTCNGTSKTLTHELGHWMSLSHTWGSGEIGVACGDDGVSDTPETMGHFSTCPAYDSTCNDGVLENIENYMDYSNCTYMFTLGQKDRMRAALESPVADRNNLWSAANLVATGVDPVGPACKPIPDFYANRYTVCPGGTVTFTKNITNTSGTAPSVVWSFPGGSPSTSTSSAATVTVTYPTAGIYPVQLKATNSMGTDSVLKTDYIKVGPTSAFYYGPAQEPFEVVNNYFYQWNVVNYDNHPDYGSNTWGLSSSAGSSGTHSVFMTAYGNYNNDVDDLISPPFNLTGMTGVSLTFKCAAASVATSAAEMTDMLKVYSSTDCGATWQIRKTFNAAGTNPFVNNGYHPEYYIPASSSEFTMHSVTVPSVIVTANTRFKFEYTSSNLGNNLYLDDINIQGTVGIDENVVDESSISIFPNPTSQTSTISYHLNKKADVKVQLVDILGKQVMNVSNTSQPEGDYSLNISKEELGLNSGIYFVRLIVDGNTITKKLIISE